MDAYGQIFARVYNDPATYFSRFAQMMAPRIHDLFVERCNKSTDPTMLDLCCGTGQLASFFLNKGFRAVGLDQSASMLKYARQNCADFVDQHRAEFVEGDASYFTLTQRFDLTTATFDAINHIRDLNAVKRCFASVARSAAPSGLFVFDMNTRKGLEKWNFADIRDTEDFMILNRTIYDPHTERGIMKASGFHRNEQGTYDRFDEVLCNHVYAMRDIEHALHETGWTEVYFAPLTDLRKRLDSPEEEERVAIIAQRV